MLYISANYFLKDTKNMGDGMPNPGTAKEASEPVFQWVRSKKNMPNLAYIITLGKEPFNWVTDWLELGHRNWRNAIDNSEIIEASGIKIFPSVHTSNRGVNNRAKSILWEEKLELVRSDWKHFFSNIRQNDKYIEGGLTPDKTEAYNKIMRSILNWLNEGKKTKAQVGYRKVEAGEEC